MKKALAANFSEHMNILIKFDIYKAFVAYNNNCNLLPCMHK